MKIVILDGYTMNPGDLDWGPLESLGDLTVYDRTPPGQVVERAAEAEVVLTNKTLLPKETIDALPELQYIGVLATGMNVVDLEAAKARGIAVRNVAGYSTPAVAQMVFAYILHFTNRVADHSEGIHAGKWEESVDFCYWDFPQVELQGRTIGIVGLGDIGGKVAEIARALGLEVIAYTRNPDRPAPAGVHWVDMETLYSRCHYITLHCPLTPETEGMINADTLARMREDAILINTGRGPLVNEEELAIALKEKQIAGAAIDVLRQEPPAYGSALKGVENCLITPHIAWATRAARQRLLDQTVANLREWKGLNN